MLLLVLVACGKAEPTEAPLPAATVAREPTATAPTPQPEPTAAPEPTPTPEPEPTTALEPTLTPEPAAPAPALGFKGAAPVKGGATYQHPSGAFSVNSFGSLAQEGSNFAVFGDGSSQVFAFFTEIEGQLSPQNATTVAGQLLQGFLVQLGVIGDYELYEEYDTVDNGFVAYFWYSSDGGEGEGDLLITQQGSLAYGMTLLSADYASVQEDWWNTIASFKAGSGPSAAGPASEEEVASLSPGAADSGFRPELHGFSFQNYGGEPGVSNLSAVELQRMFGNQVCASVVGGECILTPPAQQWMNQINGYMDGGHCEGMAVLSNLMYFGQSDPAAFGGSTAHDLEFSTEALQREIAYWWTTQATWPADSAKVNQSPSAVLDALTQSFAQGRQAAEWWAVGIYERDGSGGHAITPIAVEDQGNGSFQILVYDNNYPDRIRAITVDRNANTWQYEASTNPNVQADLYEGDANTQTLEVVAISPRLGPQQCQFCAAPASTSANLNGRSGLAAPARAQERGEFYEIWLDGAADLLIEDEDGRRIGYVEGEFVNEIAGATGDSYKFVDVWDVDSEPVYRLPVGKLYAVDVDGSRLEDLESSAVSLIGPGFFLYVDDILLDPGEMDSILFALDEGVFGLNYQTAYAESPALTVGMETEAADYAFTVQATEIVGLEDTFYVFVDLTENTFAIDASDNEEPIVLDLFMLRIDDEGEHVFGGEEFVMDPGSMVFLSYLDWAEEAGTVALDVDYDGDGEIDESFELLDTADEFEWGDE